MTEDIDYILLLPIKTNYYLDFFITI